MIPYYMGKDTQIYGKCVRKYMGNVSLGSDTYPLRVSHRLIKKTESSSHMEIIPFPVCRKTQKERRLEKSKDMYHFPVTHFPYIF